jgi:hypothetical protein
VFNGKFWVFIAIGLCLIMSCATVPNAPLSQGTKNTLSLPSGEVVWDLNGEWDASVVNYGEQASSGSYPQLFKITQTGSSFKGSRMIDDPWNKSGTEGLRGELQKSGFKNVMIVSSQGPMYIHADGQISDDGNKMVVDVFMKVKVTYTRK